MLLNKHTVSKITTVYKFTDSKNKILLLLLLFEQEDPVYTCLKPNPMFNPWALFSIIS